MRLGRTHPGSVHPDAHPFADKIVTVLRDLGTNPPVPAGSKFHIEDWWDRLDSSVSWRTPDRPATSIYNLRHAEAGLPDDDEVLYGKVGALGHVIHVSELQFE